MDPITKEILKNMVEIDDEGNIVMMEPKEYYTGDASIDFALNNACADSIDELLDIFQVCVTGYADATRDENWYGGDVWIDRLKEVRQCIIDLTPSMEEDGFTIDEILDVFECCAMGLADAAADETQHFADIWEERLKESQQWIADLVKKTDISTS